MTAAEHESLAADAEAIVQAATGQPVRAVRQLPGGFSNVTWRVDLNEAPNVVVVRFYRQDPQACSREVHLAAMLAGVVPVPDVLFADPSGDLVGTPAMVSRFCSGLRLDHALRGATAGDVVGLGRSVGAVLARLAQVRLPAPGWLEGSDLTVEPRQRGMADGVCRHVRDKLFSTEGGALLDKAVRTSFWQLVARHVDQLNVLDEERNLVHADFGHRNVLVDRATGRWRVAAVLDWEFAFSGPSLTDLGHILRNGRWTRSGFDDGVVDGYRESDGVLRPGWRRLAWLLDLVSATGGLAKPAGHPLRQAAEQLILHSVREPRHPWLSTE